MGKGAGGAGREYRLPKKLRPAYEFALAEGRLQEYPRGSGLYRMGNKYGANPEAVFWDAAGQQTLEHMARYTKRGRALARKQQQNAGPLGFTGESLRGRLLRAKRITI